MTDNICAVCGGKKLSAFQNKSVPLHDGSLIQGLSGICCESCGELWLDDNSHARFAAAGNALVLEQRKNQQHWLRQARKKLGLTQVQAQQLTGGGHNAFSRYERGEARPLPAVVNLFRLLDAHPELLNEVYPAYKATEQVHYA